jgi:hypothetical protein
LREGRQRRTNGWHALDLGASHLDARGPGNPSPSPPPSPAAVSLEEAAAAFSPGPPQPPEEPGPCASGLRQETPHLNFPTGTPELTLQGRSNQLLLDAPGRGNQLPLTAPQASPHPSLVNLVGIQSKEIPGKPPPVRMLK